MKWEHYYASLADPSLSLPRFGHSAVAVTDASGSCQVLVYGTLVNLAHTVCPIMQERWVCVMTALVLCLSALHSPCVCIVCRRGGLQCRGDSADSSGRCGSAAGALCVVLCCALVVSRGSTATCRRLALSPHHVPPTPHPPTPTHTHPHTHKQTESRTWSAPDILPGPGPGPRAFHSAVAVAASHEGGGSSSTTPSSMLVFGGHILTFEDNRKRRNFYNDIWRLDLVSGVQLVACVVRCWCWRAEGAQHIYCL